MIKEGDILLCTSYVDICSVGFDPGDKIRIESSSGFSRLLKGESRWNTNFGASEDLLGRNSYGLDTNFKPYSSDNGMTEEGLRELIKQKYPKGTKYIPLNPSGDPYNDLYISDGTTMASFTIEGNHGWCGMGYCYVNGVWSEIVKEEESIFKKGQYIVLLSNGRHSESFRLNHIYKQRKDGSYLLTELDSKGSVDNGWDVYKRTDSNWRFATPEEIDGYIERGKPYDVSELDYLGEPKYKSGDIFFKEGGERHVISHCAGEANGPYKKRTFQYITNMGAGFTEDYLEKHYTFGGNQSKVVIDNPCAEVEIAEPHRIHYTDMTTKEYADIMGIDLKTKEDYLEFQTPVVMNKGTQKKNKLVIIKN